MGWKKFFKTKVILLIAICILILLGIFYIVPLISGFVYGYSLQMKISSKVDKLDKHCETDSDCKYYWGETFGICANENVNMNEIKSLEEEYKKTLFAQIILTNHRLIPPCVCIDNVCIAK